MRSVGHDPRKKVRAPSGDDGAQARPVVEPAAAREVSAAEVARPEVVAVDLKRVRVFGLKYACPAETNHAFYEVVGHILSGRHDLAEARLASYFRNWCPATAAAVLGLPDDHALADFPPMAAVLPWHAAEPGDALLAAEATLSREGAPLKFGVSDGCPLFGPTSRRHVRVLVAEVAKIIALWRKSEFVYPPELLSGIIIQDDRLGRGRARRGWVLELHTGVAHVAVLEAMGVPQATAHVVPSAEVLRSEVGDWAHVQDGLLTEAEALQIFDRFVEGDL